MCRGSRSVSPPPMITTCLPSAVMLLTGRHRTRDVWRPVNPWRNGIPLSLGGPESSCHAARTVEPMATTTASKSGNAGHPRRCPATLRRVEHGAFGFHLPDSAVDEKACRVWGSECCNASDYRWRHHCSYTTTVLGIRVAGQKRPDGQLTTATVWPVRRCGGRGLT